MTYTYNSGSNKLAKVTDAAIATTGLGDFNDGANGGDDYDYDPNGNLTKDENKSISNIGYNILNLPEQISVTGKGTITYLYDAAGNKLNKTVNETGQPQKTTQYLGGMIFENNVLQHVATEEGRARIESGAWKFDYFLKDHLGNVRAMVADNGTVLEETHYYPFGLVQKGISTRQTGNLHNKEKTFQDQQIDEDLDLNWVQFKYRNHDPQIGRFVEIDPLSDKYVYNSTYAFSENAVTGDVELEGLERVSARYMDPHYYARQRRSYQQINSYVPNVSSYRSTSTFTSNSYNTATTNADIYMPRESSTDPTITKGNSQGTFIAHLTNLADNLSDQINQIKVTTDNIHSKNLAGGEEFSSKVSSIEITFNSLEAEKAFKTATADYNNKVSQIEADAASALKSMPAYPEKGTLMEKLKWSMQATGIEAGKNLKISLLGPSPAQQILNKTSSEYYRLQQTETRDIPEIRATRNQPFY